MSLATLEKAILEELKEVTRNKNLTKKNIMQWQTTKIEPHKGEALVYLPKMGVWVCYK